MPRRRVLMSSRTHGSEETLAIYALERVLEPSAVLVGCLGLGFSLRATLDRVPRTARVTVRPRLAHSQACRVVIAFIWPT